MQVYVYEKNIPIVNICQQYVFNDVKIFCNLEEFRSLLTAAVTSLAASFYLICVIDDTAVATRGDYWL